MLISLQASEAFLQRMTALFVASHYRNTPNDLILMSDAPAHNLFALVGPVDETQVPDCWRSPKLDVHCQRNSLRTVPVTHCAWHAHSWQGYHEACVWPLQNALPDILCVAQVALEGTISKKAALASLAKGTLPSVRPLKCIGIVTHPMYGIKRHPPPSASDVCAALTTILRRGQLQGTAQGPLAG